MKTTKIIFALGLLIPGLALSSYEIVKLPKAFSNLPFPASNIPTAFPVVQGPPLATLHKVPPSPSTFSFFTPPLKTCREFIEWVFGPECEAEQKVRIARSLNKEILNQKLNPLLKLRGDMTETDAVGNKILHAIAKLRGTGLLRVLLYHDKTLLRLKTQANKVGKTPSALYRSEIIQLSMQKKDSKDKWRGYNAFIGRMLQTPNEPAVIPTMSTAMSNEELLIANFLSSNASAPSSSAASSAPITTAIATPSPMDFSMQSDIEELVSASLQDKPTKGLALKLKVRFAAHAANSAKK